MGIHLVFGDLLKLRDVDAIIHQVNCVCVKHQVHNLSDMVIQQI
jgi:O-acetyl-ADP-ribose deacetylase (regulator of RNase III)